MKTINSFLLSVFLLTIFTQSVAFPLKQATHQINAEYHIDIDEHDRKLARVTASLKLKDNRLFMASGAENIPKRWAQFIHHLEVKNSRDQLIQFKSNDDGSWELACDSNEVITISYEFHLDHESFEWNGGPDGAAYQTEWGNFYTGRSIFILNGEQQKDIQVTFSLPGDCKVSTPWHQIEGKSNQFKVVNQTDLSQSMFFIGSHEEIIFQREDFELVFALAGENVISEIESYKQMANGVMDYYIRLMGGLPKTSSDVPLYKSIVIINQGKSSDGEVIGNNISITMGGGNDPMSQMLGRFIFAHEFFHLWNGKSIVPEDESTEWFKEGFSNYYTVKALYQIGLLNEDAFAMVINNLFYKRYRNDDGYGKIALIEGDQKHDHWGIIYSGGLFTAIAQDMMIRKNSDNEKSLDDIMRHLYQTYAGTDETYGLADLKKLFEDYSEIDQDQFFKDHIEGAEPIPIDQYISFSALSASISGENLIIKRKETTTSMEEAITDGMFGEIDYKNE